MGDMVIDAITTQKERSGSSLSAIKNHLASKYKVDLSKKSGILNRQLKKMGDEGVLVRGAQPGRKGAGCFKLSAEEKVAWLTLPRLLRGSLRLSPRFRGKLQRKLPRRKACLLARRKLSRKLVPSPARVPRGRWLPRLLVKRGRNLLSRSLRPSPPRASSEKCPKNSFAICYIT